ncbi:MAG: hypothetical protein LBF86_03215 [Helicobacteraceae bacterium]|jgi:hypothetical protein|nr:hypothetical protein [Helicobacteraceae bacterium]
MALEYEQYRAVYDGGVDYINANKHILVVKAQTLKRQIRRFGEQDQTRYSKEEMEFDEEMVFSIERFFENADDYKFDELLDYDYYTKLLELIYSKYEDLSKSEHTIAL